MKTRIALIVSDSATAIRESERYISILPAGTSVYAVARSAEARRAVKTGCADAGVIFESRNTAPDAVRMADIVVIFGDTPFTERDVEILASQGIPVEHKSESTRRKKRPR